MTTNRRPPRVALWLLARFGPPDEALTGDLVEGFAITESRWWFWRQVLAAVAVQLLNPAREVRPLRLVEGDPLRELPRARFVRREINLTASPIHGIGGLGLLALAIAVSAVDTRLWWLALIMIAVVALSGMAVGLALIAAHRPKPPRVTHVIY